MYSFWSFKKNIQYIIITNSVLPNHFGKTEHITIWLKYRRATISWLALICLLNVLQALLWTGTDKLFV